MLMDPETTSFATKQLAIARRNERRSRIVDALVRTDKVAAKILACCLVGGIAVTFMRELIWPRTNLLRSRDDSVTFIWR